MPPFAFNKPAPPQEDKTMIPSHAPNPAPDAPAPDCRKNFIVLPRPCLDKRCQPGITPPQLSFVHLGVSKRGTKISRTQRGKIMSIVSKIFNLKEGYCVVAMEITPEVRRSTAAQKAEAFGIGERYLAGKEKGFDKLEIDLAIDGLEHGMRIGAEEKKTKKSGKTVGKSLLIKNERVRKRKTDLVAALGRLRIGEKKVGGEKEKVEAEVGELVEKLEKMSH